jgi:hypothetical protein
MLSIEFPEWLGGFPIMRRMVFVLCAALLLVASQSLAAAKIVNVRVGHHPEYDRIVFDLDGWAAYQVHSISGNEIIVRVLAGGEPTQIDTEKGLVRSVEVTPNGQRSEVRIRLRTADVRVKDSTLQSPARIVIDVRKSEKTAATPPPKAEPAPKAPEPKAAPVVEKAPEPKVVEAPVEKAPVIEAPAVEAVEKELATAEPVVETKSETASAEPAATAKPKAPPVARKPVADKKIVKKPAPAPSGGAGNAFDIRLVGGGVLMLLVGVAGIIWKRRRSAGSDAGDEDDAIEGDWFGKGDGGSAVNPEESTEESGPFTVAPEAQDLPASRSGAAEAPLFGSDAPASPPTLDRVAPVTGAADSVVGSSSSSAGASGISGGQLLEIQEQLQKIEGRLSDIESARERLEQQGINQTEELRVQRAAIARTQRVLRSITRTEDDGPDAGTPGE